MHKLDKLCQFGNIINFEYSENFPNSGFTSLIFPIGKALWPLPKIAKKIPALRTEKQKKSLIRKSDYFLWVQPYNLLKT